ncbi:MAG: hypothetical protein D6701_09810 [Gemmatimonadetes bacterium]|nr:MAG: hypothetical protein D6701_09810 [Gemmatimonadota bacterium]
MCGEGDARTRVAGFSLVEVLVALVVLEVGLLGAAALAVGAARRFAAATRAEYAVTVAASLADSLAAESGSGRPLTAGARTVLGGLEAVWAPESVGARLIVVDHTAPRAGGDTLVVVRLP